MEQLTNIQEQILNGHLLGDGCLRKQGNKNAHFVLRKQINDKNSLFWSAKHFENFIYASGLSDTQYFDERYKTTYYQCKFTTRSLPVFTDYYNKWYPDGKKIVPKDLILTPLTIAVWFCDDGSLRYHNKSTTFRLATDGFSYNDTHFLCNQLVEQYGAKIKIRNKKDNFIIECTWCKTIARIFDDLAPFLPPIGGKLHTIDNHPKIHFIENPKIQLSDINFFCKPARPECPKCVSSRIWSRGYTNNGLHRYYCPVCKTTFRK